MSSLKCLYTGLYNRLIHLFIFCFKDIWTHLCLMLMFRRLTYEYWWRERLVFSYYINFKSRLKVYDGYSVNTGAFTDYEIPCTHAEKPLFHTCIILNHIYAVEVLTRRDVKPEMKFHSLFHSLFLLIPSKQCTINHWGKELVSYPRLECSNFTIWNS